jgi:hypothetical protein
VFSTFPYGSLTTVLGPGMKIIIIRGIPPRYDVLYSPYGSAAAGPTLDAGNEIRQAKGSTGYKASFCAFLLLRKPRFMVDRIAFVRKRSRWKFNV